MKGTHIVLTLVGVLALGVGGYVIYRKKFAAPEKPQSPTAVVASSLAPPPSGGTNIYDLGVALAGAGATAYKTYSDSHPAQTDTTTKGASQQQVGSKKDQFGNTIALFN
jgi:hypothetical protein